MSLKRNDAYSYSLLNVYLSQLANIENCPSSFVLVKKAIQVQFMNSLSCVQGYDIIDGILFNAKNTLDKLDSIEWYKLAMDALSKIKEIDSNILKNQKSAFMIEIAQIYTELEDYDQAENMIILSFEQDSSNLIGFRVLLDITCAKWKESDQNNENVKDVFKRMIQSQNDFKSQASIKVFMSMIFKVEKISTNLAIDCVDLFQPKLWKNKNISYDSFLVVKIYLMTLLKDDFSPESFQKQVQELTRQVSIDEDVKQSCRLLLFQAGDISANEQKWNDAIFWYSQSVVMFGDLDQENQNYGNNLSFLILAILYSKLAISYLKIMEIDLAKESIDKGNQYTLNCSISFKKWKFAFRRRTGRPFFGSNGKWTHK